MVHIALGDIDPKTAAAQLLLCRAGYPVEVDGVYTAQTANAVCRFQESRPLEATGIIDADTWLELLRGQGCIGVDVVDPDAPDAPTVMAGLRGLGCEPVSSRIRPELWEAISHLGAPLILLRLRVTPNYQGEGLPSEALRPCFAPFGSVEVHGAPLGADPKGRALLHRMAALWGVPVTAPVRKQQAGGPFWTHRFQGWAFTAYPRGGNRASWVAQVLESQNPSSEHPGEVVG